MEQKDSPGDAPPRRKLQLPPPSSPVFWDMEPNALVDRLREYMRRLNIEDMDAARRFLMVERGMNGEDAAKLGPLDVLELLHDECVRRELIPTKWAPPPLIPPSAAPAVETPAAPPPPASTLEPKPVTVVLWEGAEHSERNIGLARTRTAFLEAHGDETDAMEAMTMAGRRIARSTYYAHLNALDIACPGWRAGVRQSGSPGQPDKSDRAGLHEKRRAKSG